ncbi:MAG: hypothetical protein HKN85_01520 [Gammaproteobacteria bacterium]|nr:hypothetical protein [Gammaproteobacteria bacterium]
MAKHLIYWPVLAQILIPMVVLALNGKRKAADRAAGTVNLTAAAMDNTAWSKPVVLTSHNLANQTQLPVLFYVICLVLAGIDAVNTLSLGLAWAFVLSRCVHAYAHVNDNIVAVRFRSFLFGALVLLLLFVITLAALARA